MKITRLFTWKFFLGIFVGTIIGSILSLFFYMKNIDVANIKRDQRYLIQEVGKLRKERDAIVNAFKEKGLIEGWNKQAVIIEPEEEGK